MRLLVLSDLHNEFHTFVPPDLDDIDAVILAGDIDVGTRGVEWANQMFRCPVVMVLGNHEFYDGELGQVLEDCRAAAAPHVHLLERDEVTIGGIRFLGATLWTNFRLFGADKRVWAVLEAETSVTDYRVVRVADAGMDRPMKAADTIRLHHAARTWLSERLEEGTPERTVVVTHHAPHPGSLAAEFANDLCSAAYVSDLSDLMGRAGLWVHGHTHRSFDYLVRGTRVLCNPRGYWEHALNPEFNGQLVVEVGA